MNSLGRLHPKSDLILRTLGIRSHHAITKLQVVCPEISNEKYGKILKELKTSVYQAYQVDSKNRASLFT